MRIIDNGLDQRLLDPLSPEARELRAKGIFPTDVRLEFVHDGRVEYKITEPFDTHQATAEDVCWLPAGFPNPEHFPHSRLFRDARFSPRKVSDLIGEKIAEAFRQGRGRVMNLERRYASGPPMLIGFVVWEGACLEYLWVAARYRGYGCAEQLIVEALENGVRRAATQAVNVPAIRLYTRMGFELERALEWYHLKED